VVVVVEEAVVLRVAVCGRGLVWSGGASLMFDMVLEHLDGVKYWRVAVSAM